MCSKQHASVSASGSSGLSVSGLAALPALAVVLLSAGACADGDPAVTQRPESGPTHQPPAVTVADAQPDVTPAVGNVDSDWAVVQEYLDSWTPWTALFDELRNAPDEERFTRSTEVMDARPDVSRAIAAAAAIVNAKDAHPKIVEAAEFLVFHAPPGAAGAGYTALGARALFEHAAEYDKWPEVLAELGSHTVYQSPIGAFLEELAAGAHDPVLRAIARYYLATALMRSANLDRAASEDPGAYRQRSIDVASGLSTGYELEDGPRALRHDATNPPPRTLAQAEADLLQSIRHASVGGRLAEMIGTRLDGVEERLSSFRGRVVLIDFWATWCGPCISELPALRGLVDDLPADRFALLAISVDEEVETVKAFQETEAMPWTNWHAGLADDVFLHWDLRGFPTYVLADVQGEILARTHELSDEFKALITQTVESAETGAGS